MKNRIIFLFIILIASTSVKAFNPHTLSMVKQPKSISKDINGLYKFKGEISDKPIFLWFIVKDSVVKGEVTYLKAAKQMPITLAGTITRDDGLRLYEFMKNGNVTGIYIGKFDATDLKGVRINYSSKRELKYSLKEKDTVINNKDLNIKPGSITGEYAYQYGEYGQFGSGCLDIKQISPNFCLVKVVNIGASPFNSIAEVQTIKVHVHHNTILLKIPRSTCEFKIRLFKDLAVIDWVKYGDCLFGLNASIDGVFIKTGKKPTFVND